MRIQWVPIPNESLFANETIRPPDIRMEWMDNMTSPARSDNLDTEERT